MSVNPRSQVPDYVRDKATIMKLIDLADGRGLEVGPFDRPFFEKHETNVSYLDYRSTEETRAFAAIAPGHSAEFVVPLDYVVPGSGTWDAVPDEEFDWVLSSHALEHSPNLIGFLQTIASKLRPGGLIISMLPDKRRTFDAYRPLTTLGKLIEDYLTQAARPSIQSVFDNMFYNRSLTTDAAEAIHAISSTYIVTGSDFGACMAEAEQARSRYIDTHNYVFTDASFQVITQQICDAGLLNCAPFLHQPTPNGEMTFLNILRKSA